MHPVTLSVEQVRRLAFDCLAANGIDESNADAIADVICAAERDGCASHGLFRLPGYIESVRNGKVNRRAQPRDVSTSNGVLQIDGDAGYAPASLALAISLLPTRVESQGILAVALLNCFHFSALWYELERIAELGFVALGFLPSASAVAPYGARQPFFGTDPMGFAWPRSNDGPVVFDQSTATRARGEIMIAARDGHSVDESLGLDADGRPTTDPNAILNGGVQLPFGGYKGSSIGLMIELLGAGLLGQDFGYERQANDNHDGGPTKGGLLLIVMDPRVFGDAHLWTEHCEHFFEQLLALEGTRLPGARRHRQRILSDRQGVQVDGSLYETIVELQAQGAAKVG